MRLGHRVDGPEGAAVLVLSPSLGTTTSLFDSQLSALAQRFRVVRHDLPGHGASPLPDGPVRVEDIARDVLVLLDELGIERASFCGVSIGGMVAMWLGAHAPERVQRLTLCCTGAKLGSRDDYNARAALVRREGTGVIVPGARERWFLPEHRDTPDAQRILAELAAIPAAGYAACSAASFRASGLRPRSSSARTIPSPRRTFGRRSLGGSRAHMSSRSRERIS
jgi:3-oxoadipate enol-lactonase